MDNNNPLKQCKKTTIKSQFLKSLITKFLGSSHSMNDETRQILSVLTKIALNLHRLPGTSDIRVDDDLLEDIPMCDLEEAITEIKRIYQHTQLEMTKVLRSDTITLHRGIKGIEASVLYQLLNEVTRDQITYYFQTLAFFNHEKSVHPGPIKLSLECPIEWIWASGYTVKELYHCTDEEFIVAANSLTGCMTIPKSAIEVRDIPELDEIDIRLANRLRKLPYGIDQAISVLCHKTLKDPSRVFNVETCYTPGSLEKCFSGLGRNLDKLLRVLRIRQSSLLVKENLFN